MRSSPYSIQNSHPAAVASITLMCVAVVLRCVYYIHTPTTFPTLFIYLLLPAAAALSFAWILLRQGKKHLHLTIWSVLMGVIFFIIKATTFPSMLHTILCILLYLIVLCVYSLTILGVFPTKKLLYPLFGLPLIYHIFVEDLQIYIFADPMPIFWEWLPEISVLCIMGALFSAAFAMKKV